MSVSELEYVHTLALQHPSRLPYLHPFSSSSSCTFLFFFLPILPYLPHNFSFLVSLPLLKCSWQNPCICQPCHSAFVFSSSLLSVSLNTPSSSGQGFWPPFCVCPHAWTSACSAVVITVVLLWLCLREVWQWEAACLVSRRTNLGDNSAPKAGPLWATSGKEGTRVTVKGNVVLTLMEFD